MIVVYVMVMVLVTHVGMVQLFVMHQSVQINQAVN